MKCKFIYCVKYLFSLNLTEHRFLTDLFLEMMEQNNVHPQKLVQFLLVFCRYHMSLCIVASVTRLALERWLCLHQDQLDLQNRSYAHERTRIALQ
jgi:hypothetical protein